MSQKVTPQTGSLIERAAEIYDFKAAIKAPVVPQIVKPTGALIAALKS